MDQSTAPSQRPYGRHLLICTGGTCAPSEKGEALAARMRELLGDRRKLRNPERVKCSTVDCLGICTAGPIAVVYPDGIWYHHLDDALLEQITTEHLFGGNPVEDAVFHRLYPSGQSPAYAPAVRGDAATLAEDVPEDAEEPNQEPQDAGTTLESSEEKIARRQAARANRIRKGLIIVNTGRGKGKTTAALGLLFRAWGRDLKIGGIQFFKHENARFGELRSAERLGIEITPMGDGFTWTSKDIDETQAKAVHGWEQAKEKIASGVFDVFLLDEFTYLLHFGWLDTNEVVDWLRANKPPMLHLVITGRDAPPALTQFADLVTEMREIKHPFKDQGIRGQPGIEY